MDLLNTIAKIASEEGGLTAVLLIQTGFLAAWIWHLYRMQKVAKKNGEFALNAKEEACEARLSEMRTQYEARFTLLSEENRRLLTNNAECWHSRESDMKEALGVLRSQEQFFEFIRNSVVSAKR